MAFAILQGPVVAAFLSAVSILIRTICRSVDHFILRLVVENASLLEGLRGYNALTAMHKDVNQLVSPSLSAMMAGALVWFVTAVIQVLREYEDWEGLVPPLVVVMIAFFIMTVVWLFHIMLD